MKRSEYQPQGNIFYPTHKETKETINNGGFIIFANWKTPSLQDLTYEKFIRNFTTFSTDSGRIVVSEFRNNYVNSYPPNLGCVIIAPPTNTDSEKIFSTLKVVEIPTAASQEDIEIIKQKTTHLPKFFSTNLLHSGITHYMIEAQNPNDLEGKSKMDVSKQIKFAQEYNLTPIITVKTLDEALKNIKNHHLKGLIIYKPSRVDLADIKTVSDQLRTLYPNMRILVGGHGANDITMENVRQLGTYKNINGLMFEGVKSFDAKLFADIITTIESIRNGNYLFSFLKYLQFNREMDGRGLDGQGASYGDVVNWLDEELQYRNSLASKKEVLKAILLEFEAAKNKVHKHTDGSLASTNMLYSLVQEQLEEIEKQEKE